MNAEQVELVEKTGKSISSQAISNARSQSSQAVKEAVIDGLAHFGGKNVVESLLYILELEHSVDLNDVANQIEKLLAGLDKMFGKASYVIEEKICENLAKRLGLDPEGQSLESLIERVQEL
ncbi:MAG: hypothetical protein ACYCQJ_07975 [Nitrososphaerales archaeon]